MTNLKDFKKEIISNQTTIGSWLTLDSTAVAEIMSKSGYFDWLTIDMEHSAITLKQAQELIRIIKLCSVAPLVRVGENNPYLIKRVMDAGAHGVIVPMVNSKEEAQAAVASVKYPPSGNRGVGLARAQGYGFSFDKYKKWVEEESVVIVQIEHVKAIDNLEEILSTPGVDGSIIGPYDLSGSIGYPGDFNNPLVLEAIKSYESVCKKMKKPMGFHVVQPDAAQFKYYKDKGYTFIAVGLDTLFLGNKIKEVFGSIQEY